MDRNQHLLRPAAEHRSMLGRPGSRGGNGVCVVSERLCQPQAQQQQQQHDHHHHPHQHQHQHRLWRHRASPSSAGAFVLRVVGGGAVCRQAQRRGACHHGGALGAPGRGAGLAIPTPSNTNNNNDDDDDDDDDRMRTTNARLLRRVGGCPRQAHGGAYRCRAVHHAAQVRWHALPLARAAAGGAGRLRCCCGCGLGSHQRASGILQQYDR
jgi:hypothetical protein